MKIGSIQNSNIYTYNSKNNTKEVNSFNNFMSINKNTSKSNYIVYEKTEDTLYSGGNGTGLSFYIKYSDEYTKDNPILIAKGVDENGNEFEKKINVNNINPQSATIVEMRALEAYSGVDKREGFSSLPLSAGDMGLNERRNFMDMFRDTINQQYTLGQKKVAAYYQYSMSTYWDFLNSKTHKN